MKGGVRPRKEGVGGLPGEGLMTLLGGTINRPDLVRFQGDLIKTVIGMRCCQCPKVGMSWETLSNVPKPPFPHF